MFFRKKRYPKKIPKPEIHVFVRHCVYSPISAHKGRFKNFSREKCHQNLLATADKRVHFTFFLDTARKGDHFLKGKAIEIQEGTEAGSFLRLLEYVEKLDLHPDTIIYFLEDDYLHRSGWVDILLEGFETKADYVTLFDHKDKYMPTYEGLKAELFITKSVHWRTTPSTTNTYAMRFGTLKADLSLHRSYSLKRKITADHDKFCALVKKGAILISPIPGFSTHVEPEYASPCIDWEIFLKENLCEPLPLKEV